LQQPLEYLAAAGVRAPTYPAVPLAAKAALPPVPYPDASMTSTDTSQKVLNAFLAANPGGRNKSGGVTNTAANSAALSAFLAANPKFAERSGAGSDAASGLGTQLSGTSATDALRQELEAIATSPERPVKSNESNATDAKPETAALGSPGGDAAPAKPAAKEAEKPSSPKKVEVAMAMKPAAFAMLPESEILKNLLGVPGAAQPPKAEVAQEKARPPASPAKEAAKPASGKASPAPAVAKGTYVAKDAAIPQSPKKERTTNAKDAATSPGPGKQSPITVAWKPKVDDKSGSPKKEGAGTTDAKTASPKKDGPKPAAKETGKESDKSQGSKKVAKPGTQDGIMGLLESAFAKFEGGPETSAATKPGAKAGAKGGATAPKRSGENEYSVAELLRLRSKTKRPRELPYRVLAAKADGELLEVPPQPEKPAKKPAADKPAAQQKPVSRADKQPVPAAAQNGAPKRDKVGAPAAQKKTAEKAPQSFVWKPKA
jgi:hypothetical protein